MSWLDGLAHRVRTLLRPGAYADELKDEIDFHESLDTMHQGTADAARRRLGNRTWFMEEARRMTWLRYTDTLQQDLRHAWRGVARTPALAGLIVLTLALGIGVNAATFTLLDTIYFRRPAGVAEPDGLRRYYVQTFNSGDGVPFFSTALHYGMYRALADAAGDPQRTASYTTDWSLRLGRGLDGPRVRVVYATASYFPVLGVVPERGRAYTVREDSMGAGADVAVISHAFWQRTFGGADSALGSTLQLGRQYYTVIGVLPERFAGLDLQAADAWIPLGSMPAPYWMGPKWWETERFYGLRGIQRWQPGQAEADAEQRMTRAVRELEVTLHPRHPDTRMNVVVGSLNEALGPLTAGTEQLISTRLAGVAVIVLLIAWANVANLLLARAVQRRREIAVRLALGISRWRLVRLLTLETLLLGTLAGAAALVAATAGGAALRHLLMPEIEWPPAAFDWRVGAFTAAVALSSALAAGLVPALQASRPELTGALKAGARDGTVHRSRLRGALVVMQAALSVVLLVGAALFVRSLRNVETLDIGFDAPRILYGRVRFADGEDPSDAVIGNGMREIARGLEGHPAVESVARTYIEPMQGFAMLTTFTETDSSPSWGIRSPTLSAVSPSFFRTAGLRMLRGTGLSGGDVDAGPAEVVVNDAAAQLMWPGHEALGQCVRFRRRDTPCLIVTGVVESANRNNVIEKERQPQVYLPLGQPPGQDMVGRVIMVRTQSGGTTAAAADLEAALRRAFPSGKPIVTPMTENLEPEYRPWRLGATLFTAFGLLALLVAVIGIYSTVSYGVSQRTHEFGVRIALGAQVSDVLQLVVGGGLRTVAAGVAVGVGLSLAAGRLVTALLYGIEPDNPAVLTVVAVVLLTVAAAAALIPAWRASRVDPVRALQSD